MKSEEGLVQVRIRAGEFWMSSGLRRKTLKLFKELEYFILWWPIGTFYKKKIKKKKPIISVIKMCKLAKFYDS